MSFSVLIGPTGPVAPTFADILAMLKQVMRSIYGSDLYLESDSQDGQMLSSIAAAIHDANDSVIAAYNAFSPATAQGVGLSSVVKINGLQRLVPSNSEVVVTIGGTVGTLINFGQISDGTPNAPRWALPDVVEIPIAGTIDVTATAVDPGIITASPGTLTNMVTPVRGWQSVTNAASASNGNPVESDATLRQRQSVSTSIPALSVLDAILGAIRNITGVERSTIYENSTVSTDANGIPAHSISAVVEGGDVQTIGNTIARYKTPGTGTYGSTAVNVVDPLGIASVINFYSLTLVPMAILVFLTAETGYVSTTATLIKQAEAAWINGLAIGQDSFLSKLNSPANLTGDAATTGTGQTQEQLDTLSSTFDISAIYQARSNMTITGGPYPATTVSVTVTNVADLAIGRNIAIPLDNGSYLLTNITNKVGNTITFANAVPALRSIVNLTLMYVQGLVTIAFNEAASADPLTTTTVVQS